MTQPFTLLENGFDPHTRIIPILHCHVPYLDISYHYADIL